MPLDGGRRIVCLYNVVLMSHHCCLYVETDAWGDEESKRVRVELKHVFEVCEFIKMMLMSASCCGVDIKEVKDYHGHVSSTNFAKFRGTICEILRCCFPQIPYIPRSFGVVVLTDNTSKYKEFTVICNTKTHYIRLLMMKISPQMISTSFTHIMSFMS